MARGLVKGAGVGMVMALVAVTGGSRAQAAPSTIYRGADVKFTLGGTTKESTVVAEGLGVRVTKRVGPETVKIRIEVAKDIVDVAASATGSVTLSRRGKTVTINARARDQKLTSQARRMTEGSPALKSFDALIETLADDNRAVATSMRATWALVHALRGSDEQATALARRLAATRRGPIAPVAWTIEKEEMPIVCWAEYASTVYSYYIEYTQCLLDYAWIPGMQAVCSFEWLVKSELAWFWVIGCSGGVPV